VENSEFRLNQASSPTDSETIRDEQPSPNGDFVKKNHARFIWVVSCFLVLSGLCLNQWVLYPQLVLGNGQRSILLLIVVWGFDVSAVTSGLLLLVRRNKTTLSPRTFFFSGLMLLLMVVGMELALQAVVWGIPSLDQMLSSVPILPALPDPQYGRIPNPRFPGHDANGFRNPIALTKADCVTIGDSFTYGCRVRPNQSWPSQLQRLTDRSIYNMSLGGYGPIEELMLLNRAVEMRPSLVIYAMFIGNDIYDAYTSVYYRNQFPEFKTQDAAFQKAIADREREAPFDDTVRMQDTVSLLFRDMTGSALNRLKLCRLFCAMEAAIQSKTDGILSNFHYLNFRNERRTAMANSEYYELFETPDYVTILIPAFRHKGVNLDDPRIEEGLRISQQALLKMNTTAQTHAIDFLVLLIPNKERVIYEFYPANNRVASEAMSRVVKYEDEIRRRTLGFLGERKISCIDLLPVLKNYLANGGRPYFIDHDTHFNPEGNGLVARIVDQYMKKESHDPGNP